MGNYHIREEAKYNPNYVTHILQYGSLKFWSILYTFDINGFEPNKINKGNTFDR